MDFNDILKKRRQTFLFSDKVPEKEKIDSILNVVDEFAPSKQNIIRYNINVFKNDDEEKKLQIYKAGRSEPTEIKAYARYNPQLLAPWLIFFSKRNTRNTDEQASIPSNLERGLDMGLAASYMVLKAIDLELNYGYCACTPYSEKYINPILGFDEDIWLIIGIGYGTDKKEWFCPVYKEWQKIPPQTFKPEKDEYIRYI